LPTRALEGVAVTTTGCPTVAVVPHHLGRDFTVLPSDQCCPAASNDVRTRRGKICVAFAVHRRIAGTVVSGRCEHRDR